MLEDDIFYKLDRLGNIFLNKPSRDKKMVENAHINLDPTAFPIFVGIARMQPTSVGNLADTVGKNHSSVSRQIDKLEKQGLVQTISVFIDTMLICSTTAFMLLNYGTESGLTGMPYVQQAIFAEVGEFGIHFITISIFLFAFSSLIGNYCYAESNFKFIIDNKKALFIFRIITVIIIFFGCPRLVLILFGI